MNTKRNLTVSAIFTMTLLIVMGGVWHPAAAKAQTIPLIAGQTIGSGGQGLYVSNIPSGAAQVYIDNIGTQLPPRFIYKINFKYRAPAMEVRFLDAKSVQIEQIEAQVYVYFYINKAEQELWRESGMEQLAIWFVSEETGEWQMCPTRFVKQSGDKGIVGRLTCLAPGSGYYVLGEGNFSQYQLTPKSSTSEKAVSPYTLKVRAYIDGRSQLIIKGNMAYWHHLDWAAPGRHFDAKVPQPTYLNNTKWLPNWPDVPDAENRDCNCDSSSFEGVPILARSNLLASLYIVDSRGEVYILQQPKAANDYTLILEFDDNELMGPAWYEVNLSYATVTS